MSVLWYSAIAGVTAVAMALVLPVFTVGKEEAIARIGYVPARFVPVQKAGVYYAIKDGRIAPEPACDQFDGLDRVQVYTPQPIAVVNRAGEAIPFVASLGGKLSSGQTDDLMAGTVVRRVLHHRIVTRNPVHGRFPEHCAQVINRYMGQGYDVCPIALLLEARSSEDVEDFGALAFKVSDLCIVRPTESPDAVPAPRQRVQMASSILDPIKDYLIEIE